MRHHTRQAAVQILHNLNAQLFYINAHTSHFCNVGSHPRPDTNSADNSTPILIVDIKVDLRTSSKLPQLHPPGHRSVHDVQLP